MRIRLLRRGYSPKATEGELYLNGVFECFTLEDVARPEGSDKVYGRTAIPAGLYRVAVNMSPRFGRRLPLLLDVPGFEGIRIHAGNDADDTEGCILVGAERSPRLDDNWIGSSRVALAKLLPKIEDAQERGEAITLSVEDVVDTR